MDAYPFRWPQVIPVFLSSVSVQICVFQLVGDLPSLQAPLLAVSVDHCSISLESLFASSPLYSPIPWLALTSLSLTHCSVDKLGSPLTLLTALTYLNCLHNRQARKRNKIFMNSKQITYAFPYQVDEYSGTFPPSPPLHPPALLQPAPPIVRRRGWRSWGWRTRLNDLIWLSKEREGAVKKMEGGNREEEEGWQREIGKVKKSAARHPNLPWSLVTRNWPKERPVWILVLLCQICSVISTHNKW